MSYTIKIIKDKFSTTEEEIYKNILEYKINIDLLIKIINRYEELEQYIEENREW